MKYDNIFYKKTKNNYILTILCGVCKYQLIRYEKQGKGNLLRAHVDRIIESNIILENTLTCIKCDNIIGNKVYISNKKKYVYKMNRGMFNILKEKP